MIRLFMEKIIEALNLNVVGECSHQFKKDNIPYGVTMVYLLAESHLSIHTFVDEGKITLDLFTCSLGDENANKSIIKDFLNYLYEILMFIALHAVINFLEIIKFLINLA